MKQALTKEDLVRHLSSEFDFKIDVSYDMNELRHELEKLGWESQDNYETNGYQVDWWETWESDSHILYLSGSFWYSFLEGKFEEKE